MKIVTVSKSVVTLNNEDVKKALRLYLKDFMPISDDAVINFSLTNEETGEFTVIVETGAAQATELAAKAPVKETKERTTKPEPVSSVSVETETTPPPAPSKSLFANLKKPKND